MPSFLPRPLPGGPLRRPEGRLLLHRITTQVRWALAIGVAFLLGIPAVTADGGRPPNVVLILDDDQGYGDLSCHGNPVLRTPHLDRLHAESVRLTDFHVSPTCAPTRCAL